MGKLAIRLLREHPVFNFASDELQAISDASSKEAAASSKQWIIGTWSDCELHLSANAYNSAALKPDDWPWRKEAGNSQENGADTYPEDAYVILRGEDVIVLAGRSERAALYAVYAYCKEEFQIEWIYPGEGAVHVSRSAYCQGGDPVCATQADMSIVQTPSMRRRGFVYENLRDEPYLLAVIDWLAKNRINELFMTFMLWDELGSALAPELVKRGITLTLGGHSMKFFMPELMEKRQLDYSDLSWQPGVIASVVQYCGEVPSLTRISLWPEDAAIADNEAEKKRFLSGYIRFTERIKEALSAAGIEIAVEHIAYNAGLSWDMLELLDGVEASADSDILFAYWGRDYSQPWSSAESRTEDARAGRALERWVEAAAEKNRNICVFEYYSDHFMLSSLFPGLSERIYDDLALFRQLGIDSVTNLVVPCSDTGTEYSWKWAQGYNSYLFARCAWGDSAEAALEDYWQYAPASERSFLRAAVDRVGGRLARLTRYNFPLFPARVVDVKKLTAPVTEARDICTELKELDTEVQTILAHLQRSECIGLEPFMMYFSHLGATIEELSEDWADKGERG